MQLLARQTTVEKQSLWIVQGRHGKSRLVPNHDSVATCRDAGVSCTRGATSGTPEVLKSDEWTDREGFSSSFSKSSSRRQVEEHRAHPRRLNFLFPRLQQGAMSRLMATLWM